MVRREVILDAGGRLEGHGAAGAFVEHVTMSLLDVGLYGVESSEHHETTGTSTERTTTRGIVGIRISVAERARGKTPHLYPIRRVKCKQVSLRCVWKSGCSAEHPHSGQTCGLLSRWMRW